MTKEEHVKKILLMPIECTTQKSKNIFRYNGRIFSSQEYRGYDPDMSDFAVGFYKIAYNEILGEKEFLDKENLNNFCGDTMNTYKKIVKRINNSEAEEWYNEYHCLANFWLLPKHVGRSSSCTARLGLMQFSKSKRGIDDYVDKFLNNYKTHYIEYSRHFPVYTEKFTLENIGDNHFLEGSYCIGKDIISFSNNIKSINDIREKLEMRAEYIVCKKGIELYQFFSGLGIIE